MKKTYMAPVTKEQKIELNHIICVSGSLDSTQEITAVDNVGARRNSSLWDDDDDEY